MDSWANQTGGWSPQSTGWHYAEGDNITHSAILKNNKNGAMNWSNNYPWSDNVRGFYNAADGSGWHHNHHPHHSWSNATGVPWSGTDWTTYDCQKLLYLYNQAELAYEAALASPTGMAPNIDGSGDYSTAAQFLSFINQIIIEWNRHQCGVLPPPPKGQGGSTTTTGNPSGTTVLSGTGSGASGGVKNTSATPSGSGTASGGVRSLPTGTTRIGKTSHMVRKHSNKNFLQRLFGF